MVSGGAEHGQDMSQCVNEMNINIAVYIYIYVYVYIYVNIYIYVYVYICIMYVHMQIETCCNILLLPHVATSLRNYGGPR